MFGSEMLDVAIGLVLVYLLLSTLASALREVVAHFLDQRAEHLETGIEYLLCDQATGLAQDVYANPLVRCVPEEPTGDPSKRPKYIPSQNFAMALMEVLARRAGASRDQETQGELTLDSVRAGATAVSDQGVRRALLTALDTARGDLDVARDHLEHWFDSAMQTVSGWYKRQSQRLVVAFAVLVTVGLNANTLTLIDHLSKDDTLRGQIVQAALARSTAGQPDGDVRQDYEALQALELPLGWSDGWPGVRAELQPEEDGFQPWDDAVQPLAGWLITIVAVSLGAPFWFNLLSSLVRARTAVAAAKGRPEGERHRGSTP